MAVHTIQTKPSDAELAQLLDPEGKSFRLRVVNTADQHIVNPRGIPMWFVGACLALPLGTLIWLLVFGGWDADKQKMLWMMLPIGGFAGVSVMALIGAINWSLARRGTFLILDKIHRTLTLPRLTLQLAGDQILEFVEVHAWHTTRDKWSSESEWLRELSVLVRSVDGGFVRYPVVTTDADDVSRLAQELAEFFGVERRVLKLNWRMRRQLKAEKRSE